MADTGITIELEGTQQLSIKLGKIAKGVSNLQPAMDDIGQHLTTFYSGQPFASRGQVYGKPWQPLNAKYAVWKARHYPGRTPLVRTGLMQRSFRSTASSMHVTITNAAPYFRYHQSSEARKGIGSRTLKGARIGDLDLGHSYYSGYKSVKQHGNDVVLGGHGLPRRVMMELDKQRARDVEQIVARYIASQVDAA